MATRRNELPSVTVPGGYRYKFEGKRNWAQASDEKWDTVVGDEVKGRRLGVRSIDGARCVVVRIPGGNIIAVTQQSIR